jgi:hypothetical protein
MEVHYKSTSGIHDYLAKLGPLCQKALVGAYNATNAKDMPIHTGRVRFYEVGEFDIGVPDICFVIKCGPTDLDVELQKFMIQRFWSGIRLLARERLRDYSAFVENELDIDVEMFCLGSHGISLKKGTPVDEW